MTNLLTYLAAGQYEAVATLCEQAIVAHPQQLTAYWYLGLVRLLQQDQAEAQAVWLAATTEIDPIAVEAGLAELLQILQTEADRQLQLGRPDLAEQLGWQALELDANRSHTYLQLGHAVSLQGRLDEAIEHWQAAIELQPDFAEAYCRQAEVFQKLQQWPEAIVAYSQTIGLQPDWQLHYNLGLCLGKQRQWQAAIEQFNQVIRLQPNFSSAYGDRGWAQLQLGEWQSGEWQAAIGDLQTAIQEKSAYAPTYSAWVKTLAPAAHPAAAMLKAEFLRLLCSSDLEVAHQTLTKVLYGQMPLPQSAVAADRTQPDRTQPDRPIESSMDHNTACVALPAGFYETTREWAAQGSNCYIALDPPSLIELKRPKTIDRDVHFSFRFGQAMPLPGTFVATIPKGQFWLNANQTSNAILTADHQLLGDLSPEFPLLSPGHPDKQVSQHSIFALEKLPPIQSIHGTVAVLSGLKHEMYFHWMFDVLPRLDLLRRSQIDLDRIDYFLANHQFPFQQETLKMLGIPHTKILESAQPIQADRLIVPSYPSSPAWMSRWVCQWLRNIFLSQVETNQVGGDRLYITRQQTANRRIINEVQVIELLSQFGFQTVALESLSVLEQASLLASAEVVISPHGGGLTNTVFCQPGTKIIEIFSPNYVYPCYWLISNLCQLEYYYLTGITPAGAYLQELLYPDARIADILINLEDLKNILNLANII